MGAILDCTAVVANLTARVAAYARGRPRTSPCVAPLGPRNALANVNTWTKFGKGVRALHRLWRGDVRRHPALASRSKLAWGRPALGVWPLRGACLANCRRDLPADAADGAVAAPVDTAPLSALRDKLVMTAASRPSRSTSSLWRRTCQSSSCPSSSRWPWAWCRSCSRRARGPSQGIAGYAAF